MPDRKSMVALAYYSQSGARRWLREGLWFLAFCAVGFAYCVFEVVSGLFFGLDSLYRFGLAAVAIVVSAPLLVGVAGGALRFSRKEPAVWIENSDLIVMAPIFFRSPLSKLAHARLHQGWAGEMLVLDKRSGGRFEVPALPFDDPHGAIRRINELLRT